MSWPAVQGNRDGSFMPEIGCAASPFSIAFLNPGWARWATSGAEDFAGTNSLERTFLGGCLVFCAVPGALLLVKHAFRHCEPRD